MGDLIPLSSGNLEIDKDLKKINQTGQEKYRFEEEIREKERELKKMVFFFAALGAFAVPSFLFYIAHNLQYKFSFSQQIIVYICIIFAVAIALWISRKIHSFLFRGMD